MDPTHCSRIGEALQVFWSGSCAHGDYYWSVLLIFVTGAEGPFSYTCSKCCVGVIIDDKYNKKSYCTLVDFLKTDLCIPKCSNYRWMFQYFFMHGTVYTFRLLSELHCWQKQKLKG